MCSSFIKFMCNLWSYCMLLLMCVWLICKNSCTARTMSNWHDIKFQMNAILIPSWRNEHFTTGAVRRDVGAPGEEVCVFFKLKTSSVIHTSLNECLVIYSESVSFGTAPCWRHIVIVREHIFDGRLPSGVWRRVSLVEIYRRFGRINNLNLPHVPLKRSYFRTRSDGVTFP
jgi:hypothetical protein